MLYTSWHPRRCHLIPSCFIHSINIYWVSAWVPGIDSAKRRNLQFCALNAPRLYGKNKTQRHHFSRLWLSQGATQAALKRVGERQLQENVLAKLVFELTLEVWARWVQVKKGWACLACFPMKCVTWKRSFGPKKLKSFTVPGLEWLQMST